MSKHNKERLFEVLSKVDKTFNIPTLILNESIQAQRFELDLFGDKETLYFNIGTYRNNGAMAVQLYTNDNEPYCTLSTNLPESLNLPNGEFFVKDWSENEEIVNQLRKNGIIIPTNNVVRSGFVNVGSYKINPKYLSNVPKSTLNENRL